MERREALAALGVAGLGAGTGKVPVDRPRARLRVGHQHTHDPEVLRYLAAFGVHQICSGLPSRTMDENWSVDGLKRLRDQVEKFGIRLEMVPLPLSSASIDRAEFPSIMLGKSPERDRDIETIGKMIENVAKAGIPAAKYNLTILGVLSTPAATGRGGARERRFRLSDAGSLPLTRAGDVSEAEKWDRIEYFVRRIIPIAEANKVRLACHPHDPGIPGGRPFRGVHRVLGSVAGLKRFVSLVDSPYHGLNFCQGTVSEMLENPREEIVPVIRYFLERKKIFNVHFRNIRGKVGDFQETFPDDGDVDMLAALRAYRDGGYDGMIMPDHVPRIEGDSGGLHAFAFAFGYIQAAIQAVNSERRSR